MGDLAGLLLTGDFPLPGDLPLWGDLDLGLLGISGMACSVAAMSSGSWGDLIGGTYPGGGPGGGACCGGGGGGGALAIVYGCFFF